MKTNYRIKEIKDNQGNITYYPQYSYVYENSFWNFLFGNRWKYYTHHVIPMMKIAVPEESGTLEGAEQIIKNRTTTYVKVHNV
jgi:hypothetical protein